MTVEHKKILLNFYNRLEQDIKKKLHHSEWGFVQDFYYTDIEETDGNTIWLTLNAWIPRKYYVDKENNLGTMTKAISHVLDTMDGYIAQQNRVDIINDVDSSMTVITVRIAMEEGTNRWLERKLYCVLSRSGFPFRDSSSKFQVINAVDELEARQIASNSEHDEWQIVSISEINIDKNVSAIVTELVEG